MQYIILKQLYLSFLWCVLLDNFSFPINLPDVRKILRIFEKTSIYDI